MIIYKSYCPHSYVIFNVLIVLVENKERWDHAISRFMQKKVLCHLINVIPRETPRLELKLYTKIFEHFLDI